MSMHKLSLNLPDTFTVPQHSPNYKPSDLKDSRFFTSKSSTNKKSTYGSHSLTQQEFLEKAQKFFQNYATNSNLSQSQSVYNLHPYRPRTDGLLGSSSSSSSSSSQRRLPPLEQFRYHSAQQPIIYQRKPKQGSSSDKLKLNMSLPIMSSKRGIVSFGDTENSASYQPYPNNEQSLFMYRKNDSPIRKKQKKKVANYLSNKPKKLKKFVKKNKKRVTMEHTLQRRLSHENIYNEKEICKSTLSADFIQQQEQQKQHKRSDTAHSTLIFVDETERDEFLQTQQNVKKMAELPAPTTIVTKTSNKTNEKASKRRESIAHSMDNMTRLPGFRNGNLKNDDQTSESLIVKLNKSDTNNNKKLVYNIQSKKKHKNNVSQIITATRTQELPNTTVNTSTTTLTHDALESFDQLQRFDEKRLTKRFGIKQHDAASEGGNYTKRSNVHTGDMTKRSLKDSVVEASFEMTVPTLTKYGNTDTVYMQNIGFTHRTSNTIQGNIHQDEHGLGLFLANVKHHLSDPIQKKLIKSKSEMLLHDPRQIRAVLNKLKTSKDPNCKWNDKLQLDNQLPPWWDDVKVFKNWCHGKNWMRWVDV